MSQESQGPLACGTCHCLLKVRICKSNKNRNAGKAFVSCHKRHNNGISCSYYHWLDGAQGSLSPSLSSALAPSSQGAVSPTLPSPTLLAPTPSCSFTITLPSRAVAKPTHCVKTSCKSTWLHPDCMCQMCHRHCIEARGCQTKGHAATSWPSVTLGDGQEKTPSAPPHSLTSPSLPPLECSAATDMFADPCYASQMTAAFTKHYTLEQDQEEWWQAVDAEWLANINKVKHHIIIYAWPKVCPFCMAFFLLTIIW